MVFFVHNNMWTYTSFMHDNTKTLVNGSNKIPWVSQGLVLQINPEHFMYYCPKSSKSNIN